MSRLFFYILSLICLWSGTTYSQELGLNFLQKDQLFNGRNPAVPFPKKTVIGLPDVSGNLYNESGKLGNFYSSSNGNMVLNLETWWKSLERKNYDTDAGWSVRTFYFGKKFSQFQFGISHSVEGDAYFQYNKDLVGLIAFGNYGLLDREPLAKTQPLSLAPILNTQAYQSFALDLAYLINDNWSVGITAKYLSGLFSTKSSIQKFDLDIRDPLVIKADENWSIRSADLIQSFAIDSLKINRTVNTFGTHPGVAFSAGAFYSSDQLKIGAQLRDLGFIHWNGVEYSRSGTTEYPGLRIDNLLQTDAGIFNQIKDTLKALTSVKKNAASFNTAIIGRLILDGQYALTDKWELGGAFLYRFNNYHSYMRWAASTVFKPAHFFSIGGQVAIDSYYKLTAGLFGSIRISVVNLYMSLDQLPVLFDARNSSRFGANVGLSVMW